MKRKKNNAFLHFKKNNLLLKCKKAQEDSTLVWVFAVFVILFILMVYIAVAFSMSFEKSFNWESSAKENGILYTGDIALSQNLLSILDSEIELNGKKQKAIVAIMDSYDIYFETKSNIGSNSLIEKYGGNINNVSRDKKIWDGFTEEELNKIDALNSNLSGQLTKVLDKYCTNYKLTIPQGVITEKSKLPNIENSSNRIYFTIDDPPISDWTMIVQFPATYKGINILFQFTELNTCSPYQRVGSQEKDA